MTTLQTIKKNTVSESDVCQYLVDNTDFFVAHSPLLSDLSIPHESGKAVSLVERQVAILREQKKQLKKQLREVVQIAKDNNVLNKNLHKLSLALYEANSVENVLSITRDKLKKYYHVDECSFLFFAGKGAVISPSQLSSGLLDSFIDKNDPELSDIAKIISEKNPVCGRFNAALTKNLFAGSDSGQLQDIRSVALLPLVKGGSFGLLSIGSYDEQRFHVEKGTEFLKQLAELVSCSLIVRL